MNAFNEIYAKNAWTNGSGPGSHPAACGPLITFLQMFLRENRIRSMVDFGCGDWQFMSSISLQGVSYVGLDVVDSVLARNAELFGGPGVDFRHTPDDLSQLPSADLLFIKDVLIHVPNSYINQLSNSFTKYKYVIAVNNRTGRAEDYNRDINFGEYRPVNMSADPFNFPCATVLNFGATRMPDPRLPRLLALVARRYIWPGEKHVQLFVNGTT